MRWLPGDAAWTADILCQIRIGRNNALWITEI